MDGSKREEELKKLLQKAEQRAEAEKGREKERQRAEASEQQTQPTTLNEYIAVGGKLMLKTPKSDRMRVLSFPSK